MSLEKPEPSNLLNSRRFLYLGDIMGEAGLSLVERQLPKLKKERKIDFVTAQAENVSSGRGITLADYKRLRTCGVDACSGGNWSTWQKEIWPLLADPFQPIIRPANYPKSTPGLGYKFVQSAFGPVLIVSLLGKIVGRDATAEVENPLKTIDQILSATKDQEHVASIVNFHGDFSSEKVVIGHYLDGRVTGVIGDHWHVPTNDARLLPKGTAHQTDAGMVGVLNSSLGVKYDQIIPRWRDGILNKNELETAGPYQLNGLLFEVDLTTGKAISAEAIRRIYD